MTSLSHGCFNWDTITVSSLISPEVIIELDTIEGCSPLTINFTNNSSNADSYIWDFGDGNSSIISSLANTYQTPETIVVTIGTITMAVMIALHLMLPVIPTSSRF